MAKRKRQGDDRILLMAMDEVVEEAVDDDGDEDVHDAGDEVIALMIERRIIILLTACSLHRTKR